MRRAVVTQLALLIAVTWGNMCWGLEFDQKRFLQTLRGRNERAKHHVLDFLQHKFADHPQTVEVLLQSVPPLVDRAERSLRKPIPRSTLRTVRLLGAHAEERVTERLISLLSSSRREIVIVSCAAISDLGPPSALDELTRIVDRDDFQDHNGLRFATLRAIASVPGEDSLRLLMKLVPRLHGQLRHEVLTHLEQTTASHPADGQKELQTDREAHQGVLDELQQQLQRDVDYLGRSPPVNYYGIPIYADRVVFVFDQSNSMNLESYGSTRLARAKQELARTIQSLPEQTEFTIVAFSGKLNLWFRKLQLATPANKAKAIRFVATLRASESTATFDALRYAMQIDDNLEAIFLISDGEPSSGTIVAPAAIVEAITADNAFRYCMVNTVGVATFGLTEEFMRELAVRNDGVYRAVR